MFRDYDAKIEELAFQFLTILHVIRV